MGNFWKSCKISGVKLQNICKIQQKLEINFMLENVLFLTFFFEKKYVFKHFFLIIHTETPQRNHVEVAVFDVVFYYKTVWCVFYLTLSFRFAAYFKCFTFNKKIGHWRCLHDVVYRHQREKCRLSNVSYVWFVFSKSIDKSCICKK